MKTVYRVLTLGMLMAAFVFANATSSFAQGDDGPRMADYQTFIGCYKETDAAKKETCYAGAKAFLDKYPTPQDEYYTFVKKRYDSYVAARDKNALFQQFNDAIKDANAVNSDVAFSSGRTIWAQNPELIDVPIVLASIGFDNAISKTPNDKYNADAINYAKTVIQQLESGKTSTNYGANAWTYKTDKFPDGKSNALGWMNYTIGYIMFNRMNQKKEALPYLYKATQANSETKNNSDIYRAIGSWYVDEFLKLDAKRIELIKAAGDKDTEETLAMLALQRGYADRAVEAYARAYKVADPDPAKKAYRDSLLNRVKELYGIRFKNDMSQFDAYLASVANKTLTDPTTAVTPVVEAAPSTSGTTSSATTMTTDTTSNSTASTSRPANTSGTSSINGASTTTPAKTTPAKTTPATTKGPAKKPATKKPGNR